MAYTIHIKQLLIFKLFRDNISQIIRVAYHHMRNKVRYSNITT
jgi:hypothetical protein